MSPLLGTVRSALALPVLLLVLAGCGSDEGSSASPAQHDAVDAEVTLVSGTAGGGQEAARATRLPDDAALSAYLAQFTDRFAARVETVAARVDVGGDQVLVAQVVSIGCATPEDATVRTDAEGVVLVAAPVPSSPSECFAPVTTVAITALSTPTAGGS